VVFVTGHKVGTPWSPERRTYDCLRLFFFLGFIGGRSIGRTTTTCTYLVFDLPTSPSFFLSEKRWALSCICWRFFVLSYPVQSVDLPACLLLFHIIVFSLVFHIMISFFSLVQCALSIAH
jgi:hypothetical protein